MTPNDRLGYLDYLQQILTSFQRHRVSRSFVTAKLLVKWEIVRLCIITLAQNSTKLDGGIVLNAHNTVFGSKRSLSTSCIRRGLVSPNSIVDRHWLPATD